MFKIERKQFLTLTQGSMLLIEYEHKFKGLSNYVPTFVDTEEVKAKLFEQGLRDDLRQAMVVLELGTYHEVLAKELLANFKGCVGRKNKQQYGQLEKQKSVDNNDKENQNISNKGKRDSS